MENAPSDLRALLLPLAFEAGREPANRATHDHDGWINFTFQPEIETLVARLYDDGDGDGSRAAFEEFERGRREHLVSYQPDGAGWIRYFTTAPSDFDTFGTETVSVSKASAVSTLGGWHGRDLREVAINPQYFQYQTDRYWSGAIYYVGAEDPRVEAARIEAARVARRQEDEERARSRDVWLRYLRELPDDQLEALDEDAPTAPGSGIDHRDLRDERKRREFDRAEAARDEAWARDTATVPEGVTIVDDGAPGFKSTWNGTWIPGTPTRVYHAVRYDYRAHERDVERVGVESVPSNGTSLVLGALATEIRTGTRFRIVDPSTLPPAPVLARFGHENLKKIEKHAAPHNPNRSVWVYRVNYWDDLTILDEDGQKVRGTKTRKAIEAIYFRRHNEPIVQPIAQGLIDFFAFALKV